MRITHLLSMVFVSLSCLSSEPVMIESISQATGQFDSHLIVDARSAIDLQSLLATAVPVATISLSTARQVICAEGISLSNLHRASGMNAIRFVQSSFLDEHTVELTGWDDQSDQPYLPKIWRIQLDNPNAAQASLSYFTPLSRPCCRECRVFVIDQSDNGRWQLAYVTRNDPLVEEIWLIGARRQIKLSEALGNISIEWLWSNDQTLLWLAHPLAYGENTDVIVAALSARPRVIFVGSVPTIGKRIMLWPQNNSLVRFTPVLDMENELEVAPIVTHMMLRQGRFKPSRSERISGLRGVSWDRARDQALYGIVEGGTCKIRTADGKFEADLKVPNCAQLFENPPVAHSFAVSPEGNYVVIPDNGPDGAYLLRCRPAK